MILDFTAEDKYYYWLMISIGLDEELVGYIRDCVESVIGKFKLSQMGILPSERSLYHIMKCIQRDVSWNDNIPADAVPILCSQECIPVFGFGLKPPVQL